jgi:hypothetical protein
MAPPACTGVKTGRCFNPFTTRRGGGARRRCAVKDLSPNVPTRQRVPPAAAFHTLRPNPAWGGRKRRRRRKIQAKLPYVSGGVRQYIFAHFEFRRTEVYQEPVLNAGNYTAGLFLDMLFSRGEFHLSQRSRRRHGGPSAGGFPSSSVTSVIHSVTSVTRIDFSCDSAAPGNLWLNGPRRTSLIQNVPRIPKFQLAP